MAEYVDRYDVGSLESTKRRYSDLQLVNRLVGYMLKHRSLLALELTLLAAKTATVLAGPYLYKVTLDFYVVNTPTSDGVWLADIIKGLAAAYTGGSTPGAAPLLLSAALLYAAVALCEWAVTAAQLYYVEKLGLLVVADIREDFFGQINRLSQRFFEYGNTGRLVSRVTNDAEALKKVLDTGVIGLLADLLMAFSVLAVMAALDLQLTLIALLLAPVLALVSKVFQRLIQEAWRTARRNVASLTGKVQDLMYGAKVTKALNQEARSLREFDAVNEQNMESQIKAETVSVAFSSVVTVLSSVMAAAIWYLGGSKVMAAAQTLGRLVAFSNYAETFFEPIQSLATMYGEIQSALAGAERIFVILDQEPEVKEADEPVELGAVRGEVEFRDVGFSYVKDQPVLRDISFKAVPGEILAVFGPTGSGKSTIINLMGRFYDPTQGSVHLDGVDLRDLGFKTLRRSVSIVLQEPYVFAGTVEYNLKFGRPEATEEEMVHVAEMLGIHDTVTRLPEGYHTAIHEKGSNLSYGQRQLMCLARAILANPRIIVFDEATSSVDPYTENRIQGALRREMEKRTVILVTHRVSTVRDADRIIVLDGGRIIGEGTHKELVERNPMYRKLCEMQLVDVGGHGL
ncbi:MAG TPA: ABC transporter ATP-binding protein [Candidatus Bathyarchaeia archaeon]